MSTALTGGGLKFPSGISQTTACNYDKKFRRNTKYSSNDPVCKQPFAENVVKMLPVGDHLYSIHLSGDLTKYKLRNQEFISTTSFTGTGADICFAEKHNKLFIANNTTNICAYNINTDVIVDPVNTGTDVVIGVCYSKVTDTVYALCLDKIYAYNISANTLTTFATISVFGTGISIMFCELDSKIYVTRNNNTIISYYLTTGMDSDTYSTGTNPVFSMYCHASKLIYIANKGDSSITVIDPARPGYYISEIQVTAWPDNIVYCDSDGLLYVNCTSLDIINKIDPQTNKVVGVINAYNYFGTVSADTVLAYSKSNDRLLLAEKRYGVCNIQPINPAVPAINQFMYDIVCASQNNDIEFCPTNNKLYACGYLSSSSTGYINIIDPRNDQYTGVAITIPNRVLNSIIFCPSTNKLFISSTSTSGDGTSYFHVLDPSTDTIEHSGLLSNVSVYDLVYVPTNDRIYFGNGLGMYAKSINPHNYTDGALHNIGSPSNALTYCSSRDTLFFSYQSALYEYDWRTDTSTLSSQSFNGNNILYNEYTDRLYITQVQSPSIQEVSTYTGGLISTKDALTFLNVKHPMILYKDIIYIIDSTGIVKYNTKTQYWYLQSYSNYALNRGVICPLNNKMYITTASNVIVSVPLF